MRKTVDRELLMKCLEYNPETGIFIWKLRAAAAITVGQIAGCQRPDGYLAITLSGKQYLSHFLAWNYVHGDPGELEIDHINRIRSDNRIENLRLLNRSQNCMNVGMKKSNKSGVAGVFFHKQSQRWEFCARVNGSNKTIGRFARIEDAIHAKQMYEVA